MKTLTRTAFRPNVDLNRRDPRREALIDLLRQTTIDLLAVYHLYRQAQWCLGGGAFEPLHDHYQEQADFYLDEADLFAERVRYLGGTVDARLTTVSHETTIPDFPAVEGSERATAEWLVERLTDFHERVVAGAHATEDYDRGTSTQLRELAEELDRSVWQLRVRVKAQG